jgi:hypothetical protein
MRRLHLPIADPCHENWDAMSPVQRGRFCKSCDKQVFDLSSMTEPEARGVLREHAGGNICVRYCHDTAGNIRFRPAAPARAAALALALAACTPHEAPAQRHQVVGELVDVTPEAEVLGNMPVEPEHELMGDVEAPPDPEAESTNGVDEPATQRLVPCMGKPVIHERKGDVAVPEEPCDSPKPRRR